ncbi:MAG: sulfurtransferase [Candidatus Promineifilaceae bacterium]|nr:sulfurtransferase [Candidatus Promineifilaceae bacterium]
MHHTLIEPAELARHLDDPAWIIVDCRFSLDDTEAGRRAYKAAHIPGAVYAHLDKDLSGPPLTDRGRHPLPGPEALRALFSRLGIDAEKQVAVYDTATGAIGARLWWLLRAMGHDAVAVLNGGWAAWQEEGLPTASGVERNRPTTFKGDFRRELLLLAAEVADAPRLVDSRAPARYRGEEEMLDPVAGHIPGAANYYYMRNLDEEARFLPPERLRAQLEALQGGTPSEEVAFYCGSGVTACHNLLAQVHAGLPEGRLYAGSWSDWISDPQRPVDTGEEPSAPA